MRLKSGSIEVEFDGGERIDNCIKDALSLANRVVATVGFTFNGVQVKVKPMDIPRGAVPSDEEFHKKVAEYIEAFNHRNVLREMQDTERKRYIRIARIAREHPNWTYDEVIGVAYLYDEKED